MRRRDFIAGLGGTCGHSRRGRRSRAGAAVGSVGDRISARGLARGDPKSRRGIPAGLNETGFIDSRNVTIEFRWAYNDNAQLPELAVDLVRRRVDVIATPNGEGPTLAVE
jgi:putative ABC transport system substrate-binding protein